jgi:hypothetical protein
VTHDEIVVAGCRLADLLRQREVHAKKMQIIVQEIEELTARLQEAYQ